LGWVAVEAGVGDGEGGGGATGTGWPVDASRESVAGIADPSTAVSPAVSPAHAKNVPHEPQNSAPASF